MVALNTAMPTSMAKIFRLSALLIGCMTVGYGGQKIQSPEARMKIADNECFRQGGIGIIHKGLYIDINPENNVLILPSGKRWTGLSSRKSQLVYVWKNSVISGADLPRDFRIAESVVVSFEIGKVFFMDFSAGIGGHYVRGFE
jgi:hypothetical protein